MKKWTTAFGLLLAVACGGGEPESPQYPEARHEALDAAPAVDVEAMTQTPSGLNVLDLEVGDGDEAGPGQTVVVYYTGWFLDGEKFDSSLDRGEPFSFPLGEGRVIPGWDEGVAGMKVGGWRRLVIPPNLGYGAAGSPPVIPPNSTLVFDVELLDVN